MGHNNIFLLHLSSSNKVQIKIEYVGDKWHQKQLPFATKLSFSPFMRVVKWYFRW